MQRRYSQIFRTIRRFSSSSGRTYYEILGVDRNADVETIKAAYKAKVKELHPDVNKDPKAEEEFKIILKAYQTLKSEFNRQVYDAESAEVDVENFSATAESYKNKRRFYHNRWYNFKKPEEDLRNEFEQKLENRSIYEKFISSTRNRILLIVAMLVVYELWDMRRRNRAKQYLDFKRGLNDLRNTNELQRYIAERELAYVGETEDELN